VGRGRRTVINHIQELKRRGLIEIEHAPSRSSANTFHFIGVGDSR
jgi:hypothetical protein